MPGLLLLLWAAGCGKQNSSAPPGPAGSGAAPSTNAPQPIPGWPATNAQPRLATLKLFVGAEVVTAELAISQLQVATGMMFRKSMGENDGMLFVFGRPHRTAFYMKNTTVPLTAAYIDAEGTILELHDLEPLNETPVHAGTDQVQYVLEMPQGWFRRHNVPAGAVISTEAGRLKDVFRSGP